MRVPDVKRKMKSRRLNVREKAKKTKFLDLRTWSLWPAGNFHSTNIFLIAKQEDESKTTTRKSKDVADIAVMAKTPSLKNKCMYL